MCDIIRALDLFQEKGVRGDWRDRRSVVLGLFSYLFIATGISKIGDKQRDTILRYSKFEKGMIFGALLILVGLLGDTYVMSRWVSAGFGHLDLLSIRQSLFFSTLLVLGLQIIFSSFFLNMIGVDRAIYSGDLHNAATCDRH